MKRTVVVVFLGLMMAVSALGQAQQQKATEETKPADSLPSVDQIIDKFVQASGGKAALEKLTSRFSKGTLEIPAMGASGTFEQYQKAPNRTVTIVDIPGFGVIQQAYDGAIGWAKDPVSGLREMSGAELLAAKLDAEFHMPLKLKELYPKMIVKGKEKVGDKEAYLIEATPTGGSMEKFYFDLETGLLVRVDQERESPQGKLPIETYLEDYREIDGIKLPFTFRQSNPAYSLVIKNQEVKHNVSIEDAKFSKPSGS